MNFLKHIMNTLIILYKGAVNQGEWKIYGIGLPDEVLQKIYYKNAEKILSLNKEQK